LLQAFVPAANVLNNPARRIYCYSLYTSRNAAMWQRPRFALQVLALAGCGLYKQYNDFWYSCICCAQVRFNRVYIFSYGFLMMLLYTNAFK